MNSTKTSSTTSASKLPILIASDHAGVHFKAEVMKHLTNWNWEDLGPLETTSVDYPDFASRVAERISRGDAERGILICGTGIGMCIAANKINGIRAASAESTTSARLAREHNDANVLCLGARLLAPEYGAEIIQTWLITPFSNNPRHLQRIQKIKQLETRGNLLKETGP